MSKSYKYNSFNFISCAISKSIALSKFVNVYLNEELGAPIKNWIYRNFYKIHFGKIPVIYTVGL